MHKRSSSSVEHGTAATHAGKCISFLIYSFLFAGEKMPQVLCTFPRYKLTCLSFVQTNDLHKKLKSAFSQAPCSWSLQIWPEKCRQDGSYNRFQREKFVNQNNKCHKQAGVLSFWSWCCSYCSICIGIMLFIFQLTKASLTWINLQHMMCQNPETTNTSRIAKPKD